MKYSEIDETLAHTDKDDEYYDSHLLSITKYIPSEKIGKIDNIDIGQRAYPYGKRFFFTVDGNLVGFAILQQGGRKYDPQADFWSVTMIYLQKEYRKKGLGTKFYHFLIDQGYNLKPDTMQSAGGEAIWKKLKSQGIEEDVFHSSPHKFDQFRNSAASGEGGNAFGYGLYFADSKGVAEWYKQQFIRRFGKNYIYKVHIPDGDDYLLWDKKLSQQSAKVQKVVKAVFSFVVGKVTFKREDFMNYSTNQMQPCFRWYWHRSKKLITQGWKDTEEGSKADAASKVTSKADYMNWDGEHFYKELTTAFAYKEQGWMPVGSAYQWNASDYLKRKGIVGIKYANGVRDGYNYVIFDAKDITMGGIEDEVS